ncbi:PEP-CTERM sorting domain-containing protein [Aquabacterium sp. OR-4]|uniref:PEP-CTERM sorting domain-containing protein n=1 Tax=Aquabacterium sp. OR-4 TaxID=2978127 RepID=UPI0021B3FA22|nr:PEP-CTERM sorting domain-containing protein [Aquabacterium sp. OR-4]MDT7837680.1 PEP-CTERM sorting domain-containing protein [Aquabacterium sp. OR-4]
MIKFFTKSAIALALAASGTAFAAPTTIDLFSVDQYVSVDRNQTCVGIGLCAARMPTGSNFAGSVSSSAVDAAIPSSIIGTERDVAITQASGLTAINGAEAFVDSGLFTINNDTGVISTVIVQWDGADNSGSLDTNGLGGVDLLNGTGDALNSYFSVDVESADHGFNFTIDIYDMSGAHSFITLISNAHPVPATTSISLDAFVFPGTCAALVMSGFGTAECSIDPLLNLEDVGAIQVKFVGTQAALDMSLDQLTTTVPEPGALALVGAALAGVGFASRRRKAA